MIFQIPRVRNQFWHKLRLIQHKLRLILHGHHRVQLEVDWRMYLLHQVDFVNQQNKLKMYLIDFEDQRNALEILRDE
jgi:transcriptional regulator of heat shock response